MPSTCRSYATSQGNSIGSTTTRTRRATRRGAPGSVRAAFWPASRGVGCSARRPLLRCFCLCPSQPLSTAILHCPFAIAVLPPPLCLFASLPLCLLATAALPGGTVLPLLQTPFSCTSPTWRKEARHVSPSSTSQSLLERAPRFFGRLCIHMTRGRRRHRPTTRQSPSKRAKSMPVSA